METRAIHRPFSEVIAVNAGKEAVYLDALARNQRAAASESPVVGWSHIRPRLLVHMTSVLLCQSMLWVKCVGMAPRHRHVKGTDTLALFSPLPLFWRHCTRCRFMRVPFANPARSPL